MKINEILLEENYKAKIKNILMDYLTSFDSLTSSPLPMNSVLNFLNKHGFNLKSGDVIDLLNDTSFNATDTEIRTKEFDSRGHDQKKMSKSKVSNMAKKTAKKGLK